MAKKGLLLKCTASYMWIGLLISYSQRGGGGGGVEDPGWSYPDLNPTNEKNPVKDLTWEIKNGNESNHQDNPDPESTQFLPNEIDPLLFSRDIKVDKIDLSILYYNFGLKM